MLQKKKRKKQIGSMGHSKLPHGSGKKIIKCHGEKCYLWEPPQVEQ